MGKNLLLGFLFIFFITKACAFSITGFVENEGNHLPIAGAYVFIDNTQKFCVTDSAGNFKLDNVDLEYFDLIVAAKGFQYLSYRFTKDLIDKKIHFKLQNSMPDSVFDIQSDSVVKKNYEQWGKFFFDEIFSNIINNGHYNYILNPEVLRFSYDSSSNTLKIKATDKVYFLNELLGYMMNIFIDEITITNNDQFFSGFVYYAPLSYKNPQAIEQCNVRRSNIYNASPMRFFRALYKNTISQEGFKIARVTRAFEGSKEFKQYTENKNIAVYKNDLISPNKFIYLHDKKNIQEKDIVQKDSATDALFITPDKFSILFVSNENNVPALSSMLFFASGKQVRIEPNGMYFEPNDIAFEGYWRSIKFEDRLPFDYF
jgi:hypothetical protein